jgi:hypothetical protein
MLPNNMARVPLERIRIGSVERAGWHAGSERIPRVGESVHCIEGEAEVMRVLGRISDGSRLLELRLPERPNVPFFAASSNVLVQADAVRD